MRFRTFSLSDDALIAPRSGPYSLSVVFEIESPFVIVGVQNATIGFCRNGVLLDGGQVMPVLGSVDLDNDRHYSITTITELAAGDLAQVCVSGLTTTGFTMKQANFSGFAF